MSLPVVCSKCGNVYMHSDIYPSDCQEYCPWCADPADKYCDMLIKTKYMTKEEAERRNKKIMIDRLMQLKDRLGELTEQELEDLIEECERIKSKAIERRIISFEQATREQTIEIIHLEEERGRLRKTVESVTLWCDKLKRWQSEAKHNYGRDVTINLRLSEVIEQVQNALGVPRP